VSSEQIRLQVPPKLFGIDSWKCQIPSDSDLDPESVTSLPTREKVYTQWSAAATVKHMCLQQMSEVCSDKCNAAGSMLHTWGQQQWSTGQTDWSWSTAQYKWMSVAETVQ